MATLALADRVRLLPRPVRLHEEEPVKLRVCRACRRACGRGSRVPRVRVTVTRAGS